MGNPPFRLSDWHRVLFGNASWPFLFEVALRTGLTYVLLVIAMRLLGKRVAAQFTLFEVSIVVTRAAAIGVPLQAANRGMLPPLLIAAVVIVLQRCLGRLGVRHRRVETAISTDIAVLVRDGRLMLKNMRHTVMGRNKVFELLRMHGFQHLGQIRRAYLEPSGSFSVVASVPTRPGLSVIPAFDTELQEQAEVPGYFACEACGNTVTREQSPDFACADCGAKAWRVAVGDLEN
ncbi:MAG: YetF domain-containing protein [Janthinobacterium lividum]